MRAPTERYNKSHYCLEIDLRGGHCQRILCPLWSFCMPQESTQLKYFETGPTVFYSYLRRPERLLNGRNKRPYPLYSSYFKGDCLIEVPLIQVRLYSTINDSTIEFPLLRLYNSFFASLFSRAKSEGKFILALPL